MITINVAEKNDARARELGFNDRFEMRAALKEIAESMSANEWNALSNEQLTKQLMAIAARKHT